MTFIETWKTDIKRAQGDVQNILYLLSKLWFEERFDKYDVQTIIQILNKTAQNLQQIIEREEAQKVDGETL